MQREFQYEDGRWVYQIDSTIRPERIDRALLLKPGVVAAGYQTTIGGPDIVNVIFTQQLSPQARSALQAFFANPTWPADPPTDRERYAALTTDSDRIMFLAKRMKLL